MKITEIIRAWYRASFPSEQDKIKATTRKKTCNQCEFNKPVKLLGFIKYDVCSLCNCPINKKIFVQDKEACDAKKWIT